MKNAALPFTQLSETGYKQAGLGKQSMSTKHLLRFVVWFAVSCGTWAFAQTQTLPPGFESMPDGVSVHTLGGGEYRVFSIASAPCKSDAPAALSAARTVATVKAKAAMSRFLDESVSVEEFLEREKVRVRTADGENAAAGSADVRRTLVRIKTESSALLRGFKVFGTQYSPAVGGGGTLRLAAGVDSASISDAEALDGAIQAPVTGGTFGN